MTTRKEDADKVRQEPIENGAVHHWTRKAGFPGHICIHMDGAPVVERVEEPLIDNRRYDIVPLDCHPLSNIAVEYKSRRFHSHWFNACISLRKYSLPMRSRWRTETA